MAEERLSKCGLPLDKLDKLQGTLAPEAARSIFKDLEDASKDKREKRQQFSNRWGKILKTVDKYSKIVDVKEKL